MDGEIWRPENPAPETIHWGIGILWGIGIRSSISPNFPRAAKHPNSTATRLPNLETSPIFGDAFGVRDEYSLGYRA